MRRIILVVSCVIFLSGCRIVRSEHPWNQRPSLPPVHRSFLRGLGGQPQSVLDEWIEIPSARFANVRGEAKTEAIELLNEKAVVPIAADQLQKWCDLRTETSSTLKPFLVRGLSYEPVYDWCHIYYKTENRELWIQRICTNGETILTGIVWTIKEAPAVVLLDSEPARISVTAHFGGDSVIATNPMFPNSKPAAFWLVGLDYPTE